MKWEQMTESIANPWEKMSTSTERRIDSDYNLFWMTDSYGSYGFYIKSERIFSGLKSNFKLRGITIVKRNTDDHNGELYLIVNNNSDWQLFHTLCLDLINTCNSCINQSKMINAVENRLKKWQLFLMIDTKAALTLQVQMGLFAELICLKDYVIPKLGIKDALLSWVGPDFDKQDFSTKESLIEVKSYLTSKGPVIHISSIHQLDAEKEPLFLIAFGLTQTESGVSIEDLISELSALLEEESINSLEIFENKLIAYGYLNGVTKGPFDKFKIDNVRSFLVSIDFPKISLRDLKPQITAVNYSIDLSLCSNFEINIQSIFNTLE